MSISRLALHRSSEMKIGPRRLRNHPAGAAFDGIDDFANTGRLGEVRIAEFRMIDQPMNWQWLMSCYDFDVKKFAEQFGQKRFCGPKLTALSSIHDGVKRDQRIVSTWFQNVDSTARSKHSCTLLHEASRLFEMVDHVANQEMIESTIFEG